MLLAIITRPMSESNLDFSSRSVAWTRSLDHLFCSSGRRSPPTLSPLRARFLTCTGALTEKSEESISSFGGVTEDLTSGRGDSRLDLLRTFCDADVGLPDGCIFFFFGRQMSFLHLWLGLSTARGDCIWVTLPSAALCCDDRACSESLCRSASLDGLTADIVKRSRAYSVSRPPGLSASSCRSPIPAIRCTFCAWRAANSAESLLKSRSKRF
mmetsp:Transcript_69712/g.179744  ORF Transcript_69712/g.179744 Transcript_69712/m.179744 type:complete len:212 (-) Transcript_69712:141-776(-)